MSKFSSSSFQRKPENSVTVGSRVRVRFSNGNIRAFTITNQAQAVAPHKGVISNQSPLGAALIGKTVGDYAKFVVGTQTLSVEIIEAIVESKII